MKKLIGRHALLVFVFPLLALSGCATGTPRQWTATEPSPLARDQFECRAMLGSRPQIGAISMSRSLTGTMQNLSTAMSYTSASEDWERHYSKCMAARGWKLQ